MRKKHWPAGNQPAQKKKKKVLGQKCAVIANQRCFGAIRISQGQSGNISGDFATQRGIYPSQVFRLLRKTPRRRRLFPFPSLPFGQSPAHSAVAARERSSLYPFAASRTVRLAEMLGLLPRLILVVAAGIWGRYRDRDFLRRSSFARVLCPWPSLAAARFHGLGRESLAQIPI